MDSIQASTGTGRTAASAETLIAVVGLAFDEAALLDTARADLKKAMGLRADPARHWVFRLPRGIPQYEPDHGRRLAEAARMPARWPTLLLAGNSYRGISANSCLEEAAPLLPVCY
ncbi:MAG: hypothetical protein MUE73_11380 [Planctomycetes bacterium]|nr:hypothetical protein [Planctomycetota bacterium]